MRNQRFISVNLDFLGFFASLLCAVHCAVVPILLTLGSIGSMAFLNNPLVEGFALTIGFGFASLSLFLAYKKHRNPRPVLLLLAGSIIIITGHLATPAIPEAILASLGAITIATAHYTNWKLNSRNR